MGTSIKDEKAKDESQNSKSKKRDSHRRERSKSREHDRSKRRQRSSSRDREGRSRRRHRSDSRDKDDVKRRGRSRSRDRDDSSSKKAKDKDSRRHNDDTDHGSKGDKRTKDGNQPDKDTTSSSQQEGAATESLSIEETNKLRAQLGLAPLQVDEDDKSTKEKEFVHVPAVNMGEMKETEKLKERLATLREKRMIAEKLKNVKNLNEIDDGSSDDIHAWVEKSRKLEKEKEVAKKRATMLEEMDSEFGIGNLVEAEFGKKISQSKSQYRAGELTGLKIEHSKAAFEEGRNVILTLQDKGILEDNEDVLENVNIKDDEKADKNVELKKKKPDYQPYDDDEWDEHGMPKARQMLSKYNEVIDGEKKSFFRLDSAGMTDMTRENELKQIQEEIKAQSVDLKYSKGTIASEFYTPEEMVQFKKPKKKRRKIRKSENLKVDDLIPLEQNLINDHGSRTESDTSNGKKSNNTDEAMNISNPIDIELDTNNDSDDEFNAAAINDNVMIVDEAELELENLLARNRKRKQQEETPTTQEEKIRQIPEAATRIDATDSNSINGITFNTTAEFCRSLGETISNSRSSRKSNPDRTAEVEADKEFDDMDIDDDEDDNNAQRSAWEAVDTTDERKSKVEVDESEINFLNDEPIVSKGVMSALLLASKKGYIDTQKKVSSHKPLNLPSTDYVVEDQNSYEIEDKFMKDLTRSSSSSRHSFASFKEKEDYKPGFKLEYFDDSGRRLNSKEAFRELSHRFHGKVSGKKKTEKRNKKLAEEEAFKKMSSTDTPLGTVNLMRDKMEQTQNPFLVLSGGGKGLINAIPITKDKKK